jgi:prepilin-type N-terminal cleavage/methylation domain-containing protein
MLSRIRKAMDEREEGFTLIELLVVIIIIGILAAIAIPVFLNQRKKGVEASQKSDLRTVANEMETYFVDHQSYVAPTQAAAPSRDVTIDTTTVKVSNNTRISGTVSGGAYCLTATNSGSDTTWYYDSDGGGLTKSKCD